MGIKNINALIEQSVAESHDDTDVPAALERETHDGPGYEPGVGIDLPPSDFDDVLPEDK